jgi:hypothetical protein
MATGEQLKALLKSHAAGDEERFRSTALRIATHSARGSAAEVAATNLIAVHPVTGWWRERPHLGRCERMGKYSLIATIDAPDVDADLYTAIATQAAIATDVTR